MDIHSSFGVISLTNQPTSKNQNCEPHGGVEGGLGHRHLETVTARAKCRAKDVDVEIFHRIGGNICH